MSSQTSDEDAEMDLAREEARVFRQGCTKLVIGEPATLSASDLLEKVMSRCQVMGIRVPKLVQMEVEFEEAAEDHEPPDELPDELFEADDIELDILPPARRSAAKAAAAREAPVDRMERAKTLDIREALAAEEEEETPERAQQSKERHREKLLRRSTSKAFHASEPSFLEGEAAQRLLRTMERGNSSLSSGRSYARSPTSLSMSTSSLMRAPTPGASHAFLSASADRLQELKRQSRVLNSVNGHVLRRTVFATSRRSAAPKPAN